MGDVKLIEIKEEKDDIIFTHGQECYDILKANYEDKKYTDEIWKKGEALKQVARIPFVVWLELERLGIAYDQIALLQWLEKFGKEYKMTTKRL